MRKRVFGRKLKRDTNQRKALFKSLTQALALHGRIKTTEAKAKAVRGQIEKLITHAMKDKDALSYLKKHVHTPTAERLIVIAPAFKDRNGGYTRIVKIGGRRKDNAPMVILEFVEKTEKGVVVKEEKKEAKKTAATAKPAASKAKVAKKETKKK